jgi:hypothetical protein
MFHTLTLSQLVLVFLASYLMGAKAQTEARLEPNEEARLTMLPTDRALRANIDTVPLGSPNAPLNLSTVDRNEESPPSRVGNQALDLKSLLRPRVELFSEWEPESDGLAISSFDLSAKMPVYPFFGPPPPFINTGYSFTRIDASAELDLPESLHDFSIGLAWMRRINDRWIARFMLNGAFASDMDNTSSDGWQIRAGGFALFRPNERWSWAFGALATGRNDVPVIPAVGVIWEPSSEFKVNLMMPNPRVSFLLAESSTRQHWGYVGGGLSGGTWAYDRDSGLEERLTYREFRLVLGWESIPPRPPGTFRTTGTRLNTEVGYVFGREFEFDRVGADISLADALLLRTGISF